MLELLSDEKLNQAWDNTFATPVNLDHKPTPEEIFNLQLRAVAQASQEDTVRQIATQIMGMAGSSAGFPEFHTEMLVYALELKGEKK